MGQSEPTQMADERRALLTEREREILSGEADVTDNYKYSVESRVRTRLRERLEDDIQILLTYYPEIYDDIVFPTVCQPHDQGEKHNNTESEGSPTAELEDLVAGLDFDRDLSDARRDALIELLAWVRDRDEPVSKSDFTDDFWTDELADRTGYQAQSFWEAFARRALNQLDAIEQPGGHTYRWRTE